MITIHLSIPCSHDLKILDYVKISLGFFIAGLIILMLFIYFESLRFLWPMNWIIAIILVCYRFVSMCYHAFKKNIPLAVRMLRDSNCTFICEPIQLSGVF